MIRRFPLIHFGGQNAEIKASLHKLLGSITVTIVLPSHWFQALTELSGLSRLVDRFSWHTKTFSMFACFYSMRKSLRRPSFFTFRFQILYLSFLLSTKLNNLALVTAKQHLDITVTEGAHRQVKAGE